MVIMRQSIEGINPRQVTESDQPIMNFEQHCNSSKCLTYISVAFRFGDLLRLTMNVVNDYCFYIIPASRSGKRVNQMS